jgi:DNA polymerase-3 subunit gamma/tau
MRDAESMLDQLLSTGDGALTADGVRELLGLADQAAVSAFVDALVSGDAANGIAILDDLEERGRDLRTFGEQVIDALRATIAVRLADPSGGAASGFGSLAELARAARRLAGTDLNRNRSGGARLALELALLAPLAEAVETRSFAAAREAAAAPSAVVRPVDGAPPARRSSERAASLSAPAAVVPEAASVPTPTPVPVASQAAPAASIVPEEPAGGAPGAAIPKASPAMSAPAAPAQDAPAAPQQAAAPTAAAPTAPAPSAGDADSQIALVRARWPEILAAVSRNPAARPLIEACRPIAVEGRVIVLGFPEDKAFLATALERRRSVLEQGISQVLGAAYGVRCVATNVEEMPAFAVDDDGRSLLEKARRIFVNEAAGEAADIGEVS